MFPHVGGEDKSKVQRLSSICITIFFCTIPANVLKLIIMDLPFLDLVDYEIAAFSAIRLE